MQLGDIVTLTFTFYNDVVLTSLFPAQSLYKVKVAKSPNDIPDHGDRCLIFSYLD